MNSFLHAAAHEAIESSGLDMQKIDKSRVGLCVGNMASSNTQLLEYIEESRDNAYKTVNRLSMLQVLTNIPCATLNVKYKFNGPSLTVSTACATGLSAVLQSYKWIKYGEADIAVVGAT